MKKSNKKKQKIPFVTVELIANGFLINVPCLDQVEKEKHFKSTNNGVVDFMEKAWGVKYIHNLDHKDLTDIGININIPTTKNAEKSKN